MTEETKAMEVHEQEIVPAEETERMRARSTFVPRADIYETDEGVIVLLDMPGVNGASIDITLEKNILNINGFSEMETPEGYTLAFAEYEPGDYERSFRLSGRFDRENIEAVYNHGVLRLTLPKAEKEKARKISVKGG
jgi:HSP20 family molecular chaperone IbpA